jgi:hypothetical protein
MLAMDRRAAGHCCMGCEFPRGHCADRSNVNRCVKNRVIDYALGLTLTKVGQKNRQNMHMAPENFGGHVLLTRL